MRLSSNRLKAIAAASSVVLVVTLVLLWRPWNDDSESASGPMGDLAEADLEELSGLSPSPDCASESDSPPEGATIALDVVRIEGSCLDAGTVWTTEEDLSDTVESLRAEPGVRAVSVSPPAVIDQGEELRADLWGLDSIGADESEHHPWPAGTGVTVAVIDTGIDTAHPDLEGKVVGRKDFKGQDPERLDGGTHGTHVAGTIAAAADGAGIVGVAPSVELLDVPARLFDDATGTDINPDAEGWVPGLAWAVNNGADIANLSLGSLLADAASPGCLEDELADAPINCLDAAVLVAAFANQQGVAVVTTSGNRGRPNEPDRHGLQVPAVLDNVTTVGGIDRDGTASPGGSRNDSVDLMAPGVDIVSAVPTYEADKRDPDQVRGDNGASYWPMTGTSMAAPHVSGAYAALMEAFPESSVEELTEALTETASAVEDEGTGAGTIDIPQALRHLMSAEGSEPPTVTPIVYRTMAGQDFQETVWAWTGGDPVEIVTSEPETFHSGFTWAPDGTRLAATAWSADSGSQLLVWDLDGGGEVTAPLPEDCSELVFTEPDGETRPLVAVCGDRLEHYDSATLESLETVEIEYKIPDPLRGLDVVGSDSERVYVAEYELEPAGILSIEIATGAYEQVLEFDEIGARSVRNAIVDPSENRIALISGFTEVCALEEARLTVVNMDTQEVLATQNGFPDDGEGTAALLADAYFNGGDLYVHPEPLLEVIEGGCAYSALPQGGVWRLSESGWEMVAPESVEFAVPIANVAAGDSVSPGVFVIELNESNQVTCSLVELPWNRVILEAKACSMVGPVTGPASGPVNLADWNR